MQHDGAVLFSWMAREPGARSVVGITDKANNPQWPLKSVALDKARLSVILSIRRVTDLILQRAVSDHHISRVPIIDTLFV